MGTRGRPRASRKNVIQRDLSRLGTGWPVEEAEVAAQDLSIWKLLTSHAAGVKCMMLTDDDEWDDRKIGLSEY